MIINNNSLKGVTGFHQDQRVQLNHIRHTELWMFQGTGHGPHTFTYHVTHEPHVAWDFIFKALLYHFLSFKTSLKSDILNMKKRLYFLLITTHRTLPYTVP